MTENEIVRAILGMLVITLIGVPVARANEIDDLRKIVAVAIQSEVEEFDSIEERLKKKRLKPGEAARLFGRAKLNNEQQQERLHSLREQVLAGEVSFREFSFKPKDMNAGQFGVWPARANPVKCEFVAAEQDGFVGTYRSSTPYIGVSGAAGRERIRVKPIDNVSDLFLLVGIPGGDDLVDDKTISIGCPVIITGRWTYLSLAGEQTIWRIESLAHVVKRIREADAKAAKKK